MVLELRTHNRRMDMLGNWSVGDREEPPSYQISRRPISRIVIPTFIAEMALSRNFSGISKKALYSVPSFFWSLNFILFFACWSFCALRTTSSTSIFATSPPLSSQIWTANIGFSVSKRRAGTILFIDNIWSLRDVRVQYKILISLIITDISFTYR